MPVMGERDLCVYCRKRLIEAQFRPFCSERCRLLDLARWADGGYRVAGEPLVVDDEGETRQPES